MIIKSYEINKINIEKNKFFLFYGKNEGLKQNSTNSLIKNKEIKKKIFIANRLINIII